MTRAKFDPVGPLKGSVVPPPDKSISHRAALVAGMCDSPVTIRNYLDSEDTNSTLAAVEAVGAGIERRDDEIVVRGVGLRGAQEVLGGAIDVGNAGTLMRLMPGWLAGQPTGRWTLDGDESIRRRPMGRIVDPLREMGARIDSAKGGTAPLKIEATQLTGIDYTLPVASAQVKSCLLLAGLLADGETRITEKEPSRDHTERMLAAAGVLIRRDGVNSIVIEGDIDELDLGKIDVPGDLSSAAFMIAAGVLVKGSRLLIRNVGLNRTRIGILSILERMGAVVLADPEKSSEEIPGFEPVGDLDVAATPLVGTVVEREEIPLAIDELPLVALLGVFAEGQTIVRGAEELRFKESDRIATVVEGLSALGAEIEATADGFVVTGTGRLRGGTIASHGDHRLAMLGAVAGLASEEGVTVDGMEAAAVSFPTFERDLRDLTG
jgi:3-phosphoshikimate 1-carboxyvinyltransferase